MPVYRSRPTQPRLVYLYVQSINNATRGAPHPVTGKVPHMRLHVSSDALSLKELADSAWTKYLDMDWHDRTAAEVEFVEQSKEYIPYGSDYFLARVRKPARGAISLCS